MSALTIFNEHSEEYFNLKKIKNEFNKQSKNIQLTIETVYLDVSQNWLYTTLIANDPKLPKDSILSSWQALSSKEQETAVYGTEDERNELIQKLIEKYRNR